MTDPLDELLAYRRDKDEAFRTQPESPIPPEERPQFGGLHYFPPDPAFAVTTQLVPPPIARLIRMPTSDGDERNYVVAGHFDLQVPTGTGRLIAYTASPTDRHLFLPFKDTTAPHETYGAGRYLDPPYRPNEPIVLDFNYAYNPFCAYNDLYSCPFPPRENWLPLPIPAGEMNHRRYDG